MIILSLYIHIKCNSSIRLIERPIWLETDKISQFNFLMFSKSYSNSLDEDENNRKVDSPVSNNSCMPFKCCAFQEEEEKDIL